VAALFEEPKNSNERQQFFDPSILSFPGKKMAINFTVPEVNSLHQSFFLLYFYFFANLFIEYIFPLLCFFPVLSTFKPFRNWLIKL